MSDITKGKTFSDTEQVTAGKLHSLVEEAVINPEFVTGKTAATAAGTGDLLAVYDASAGGLRKMSVAALCNIQAISFGLLSVVYPAGAAQPTQAVTLPGTPQFLRAVLVCTTADLGWAVGDEIDVCQFEDSLGRQVFAPKCTATVASVLLVIANVNQIQFMNRISFAYGFITTSSWTLKMYVGHFAA